MQFNLSEKYQTWRRCCKRHQTTSLLRDGSDIVGDEFCFSHQFGVLYRISAVFSSMDIDGIFGRSDIASITNDSVTTAIVNSEISQCLFPNSTIIIRME